MRSVAIALSLCALLGCGLALIPPSNPGDTYTYTYQEPGDCTLAGGNCTYFVGIQLNAADFSYLDFYLEGVAAAWVAVGFSMTASMFDADVLGCVVIGTDAAAVDTWNVASPGRNNVLDAMQDDIIEHATSFTNGRIICNFSRLIAVTDEGQDLDLLEENYWLLYGHGQNVISGGNLPRALNSHVLQGTPTISNARVDLGITIPPPNPSEPTNPPEDYPFTYRTPEGCTVDGGDCDYFLGIQENEDNPDYLDFYLEGVAVAWVAVGFSTTAIMFNADVLGCVRIGDGVKAVDTWNVVRPVRNNVLDDSQDDIIENEAAFADGRIICNFTRKVAITNVGQDLDLLAQDYWLLYGIGPNEIATGDLPRALNTHWPQRTPTISNARVDLGITIPPPDPSVPTNPPEDYPFTYRVPEGCTVDGGDCDYLLGIQENEDNPDYLDFYLEGVAVAWVAVGFSTTASMFNADVLGCVRIGDGVKAVDTWNVVRPARLNVLDDSQDDIIENVARFADGRITCSFTRKVAITNVGQDLDLLAQDYWLLYGRGQNEISSGTLPRAFNTHRPQANPTISDAVVDITPDNTATPSTDNTATPSTDNTVTPSTDNTVTPSTVGGQMIQAQGLLMIITLSVLAVTAAFFAA